jgi:hypothetical protein
LKTTDFNWTVVLITAIVAISIFFVFNYCRQRYWLENPFLNKLEQMDEVEAAEMEQVLGKTVVTVTPNKNYRGSLRELVAAVEEEAAFHLGNAVRIEINDRRNRTLQEFNDAALPSLYEGARLGNYRTVQAGIEEMAKDYGLEKVQFSVDYNRIFLQARDGDYYLYLIIPLTEIEGGKA